MHESVEQLTQKVCKERRQTLSISKLVKNPTFQLDPVMFHKEPNSQPPYLE